MKTILRMLGASGLLCLMFAVPARAQITNSLNFKTTFPFTVNNTLMPSGSYMVTQTDQGVLSIRDSSGTHNTLVQFDPTTADSPHTSTDVTFHRYGKTEFLTSLWVVGQTYGMQIPPTEAEKKLAATAKPVTHKVSGAGK